MLKTTNDKEQSMLAVTAIIRPEKIIDVQDALYSKGFCAMTKINVSGRGKERGIKVGDVLYQEMTKIMIYMVVEDDEKDIVVDTLMQSAMTGESGNPGDGKIFVSPVYESYTISNLTGVIDADYPGPLMMPLWNHSNEPFKICMQHRDE